MLALIRFINNIRYLFRYDLKSIAKTTHNIRNDFDTVHYAIENIKFEIEEDTRRMQKFTLIDDRNTIQTLLTSKRSLARFGDGEFNLIFGNDIPFQRASTDIAHRLSSILSSTSSRVLIAIPNLFMSFYGGGVPQIIVKE